MKIPQDQLVDGRYITKADAHTTIPFQALFDLLRENVKGRRQMLERQPIHVRWLDGSIDLIEIDQVNITEWMRLITLEELEHAPDRREAQ